MKSFCYLSLLLVASAASGMADTSVNIGTANASAPATSSFTFAADGSGNVTLTANTLDTQTTPVNVFALTGTPTVSAGFGSSVSVSLMAMRPINTTTGTGTALTGTPYTLNALGMGIASNPDGNFLGSDGTTWEGIQLSVDTSALGSGYKFQLLGFKVNTSTNATTAFGYSVGLINASTSTSENFFQAAEASGLKSFTLSSPLELGGGNGSTFIGTFWQPEDQAGYRLRTITFDIVAVPEPSTLALAGLGIATLLLLRRNGRR